jgi:DNA-binding NtrC family response regulator
MNSYILIVDDDQSVRNCCTSILDAHGFQSKSAEDGLEALKIIADEQPTLVISDYYMPNLNGAALFFELKNTYPDIKFLLISGSLHEIPDVNKFPNVLDKPFSMTELISAVQDCLKVVV